MNARHAAELRAGIHRGRELAARVRAIDLRRGHYFIQPEGTKHQRAATEHTLRRELSGTGLLVLAKADGNLAVRSMWGPMPARRPIPSTLRATLKG